MFTSLSNVELLFASLEVERDDVLDPKEDEEQLCITVPLFMPVVSDQVNNFVVFFSHNLL